MTTTLQATKTKARTSCYRVIDTFAGPFVLMRDASGQLMTSWMRDDLERALSRDGFERRDDMEPDLTDQLQRYFAREPVTFDDIELPGDAPFFARCWRACQAIPPGETRSYGELAELAGSDRSAARAAGQAMRRNPLPVIVPCHRVVSSAGKLHGYGGSTDPHGNDLQRKAALLKHERAMNKSMQL